MDASLVLAIDCVRDVAEAAAEIIAANGGDDGDRVAFTSAADVESACECVLARTHTAGAAQARGSRGDAGKGKPSATEAAAVASPATKKRAADAPSLTFASALRETEQTLTHTHAPSAAEAPGAAVSRLHALRAAVLSPITDLVVLFDRDPTPPGFERVSASVTGAFGADLNAHTGPRATHLAVARTPGAPAITAITMVMLELGEFIPPGFTPVRHFASGRPANLRQGVPMASDAILCVYRGPGAPIVDVGIAFPRGAAVKPSLSKFMTGEATDAAPVIAHARAGFSGTAGEVEAAHERGKSGILASLANLPLIGRAAREDVPEGYSAVSRSILGCAADLTGGSARGMAVLVYAKDLSHVDFLADRGGAPMGVAPDADEDAMTSQADAAESDFRKAIEAMSYSSGSSPVLPLSIARRRAARRRARRQFSEDGTHKLDSMVAAASHADTTSDPAAATPDAPGSTSKTIADRITDTLGKLFRMGSTRHATEAGAASPGLTRSPSIKPATGFSSIFSRQKSLQQDLEASGSPQPPESSAELGAAADTEASSAGTADPRSIMQPVVATPHEAGTPATRHTLSVARAAGIMGSDDALMAGEDPSDAANGRVSDDESDDTPSPQLQEARPEVSVAAEEPGLASSGAPAPGRTGPTRATRARSASVAEASPSAHAAASLQSLPLARAASDGEAFVGLDDSSNNDDPVAVRGRSLSVADALGHSTSATNVATASVDRSGVRARSEPRGSRQSMDGNDPGVAGKPSGPRDRARSGTADVVYRPRVESDHSDGVRSVVGGPSAETRLHGVRLSRGLSSGSDKPAMPGSPSRTPLGSANSSRPASPQTAAAPEVRPSIALPAAHGGDANPADIDDSEYYDEETEVQRARSIVMFRHMSWMFSPAATRMAISAAGNAPAPDGSVAETNALLTFLEPSAASLTLTPLLRALYSRNPDLVNAALKALTFIVEAGFFMTSPVNLEAAGDDGLSELQEHALIMASAWALLDVVVACVCDAVNVIVDFVHEEFLPFVCAVLQCAGANGDASSRVGATVHRRHLPPCGLHPATLHRLLTSAMLVHTYSHQKRIYAERAYKWCLNSGAVKDAETYNQRLMLARRNGALQLQYLKAMVHGVVASVERDASLDAGQALSAIVLGSTRKAAGTQHTPPKPSVGVSSGAVASPRTVQTSFSDLSYAFTSHATSSSSLAAELHSAVQAALVTRPHPELPMLCEMGPFDAFHIRRRAPCADAVVLIALLSKSAAEPVSFAPEATLMGPTGGAPGGAPSSAPSSKRLTSLLQRDTALYLLSDVFSLAGCAFAASPAIVAAVSRFACPALLSHALTARILTAPLSIACPAPDRDVNSAAASGHHSRPEAFGAAPGVYVAPMTLYKCLLQVMGALWTARGSDEGAAGTAAPYASLDGSLTGVSLPVNTREACSREIAALFRGVVLPVLASRIAPPQMKIETVEALSTWLGAPQNLMELYINHDMWPSAAAPYPHERLLRSIVATLVNTISSRYHRADAAVGASTPSPSTPSDGVVAVIVEPEPAVHPDALPPSATPVERAVAWDMWYRDEYRRTAALLVTSIVRCLMDSAATVHLQSAADDMDMRFAATKSESSGTARITAVPPTPERATRPATSPTADVHPEPVVTSVRSLHNAQDELERAYQASLAIFKEKGVRKGLVPLLEKDYVEKCGGGIAHFLRLCGSELTVPAEIGDYLGDEGRGDAEKALMTSVRHEYFAGMSFAGMSFDVALRVLLTKGGFRLPGEAQKINRVAHAFAVAFYEDNKPSRAMLEASGHIDPAEADTKPPSAGNSAAKPPLSIATSDGRFFPTSADVVEILTFSCIMLNTDAHNPSIKKEKKMTRKQFIGNNRGIDHDRDVAAPFLEHLYDAITQNEIKMEVPTAASIAAAASGGTAAGAPASSAGAPCLGLPVLPGTTSIELEHDGALGVDHAPAFIKQLSETAFRWVHTLSAQSKMDDLKHLAPDDPRREVHGAIPRAYQHVPYRRNFSTTTVSCAMEDLWPSIMRLMVVVLRVQPKRERPKSEPPAAAASKPPVPSSTRKSMGFSFFGTATAAASHTPTATADELEDAIPIANLRAASPQETEIRLAALDALKFALSACIFIAHAAFVRQGADALLQVEAAALGRDVAKRSLQDGWYAALMAFADTAASGPLGGDAAATIAGVIGELHIAVAEMRDALTNIADKAVVETTAGKFAGEISKLLAEDPRRKLVYEGELTKVASKGAGRHTVYRFFLFNDNLVYGSKPLFGTRYNLHQIIPLKGMRLTENPDELRSQGIASSIKLENDKKNLFLYGPEQDMIEWRRHIREAITELSITSADGSSGGAAAFNQAASRRGSVMPAVGRRDSDMGARGSSSRLTGIQEASADGAPAGRASLPPTTDIGGLAAPAPPPKAAPPPLPPAPSTSFISHAPPTATLPPAVVPSAVTAPLDARVRTAAPAPALAPAPASASASAPTPAPSPAPAPADAAKPAATAAPGAAKSEQAEFRTPSTLVTGPDSARPTAPVAAAAPVTPSSARGDMQSIADLKSAFLHAVAFCRPLLTSDAATAPAGQRMDGGLSSPSATMALTNADKLAFYAYFRQATHGDCPVPSSDDDISMMATAGHEADAAHRELTPAALAVTKAKRNAWRQCAGMRRRDAMKAFVELLDKAVPSWDNRGGPAPLTTL